MTEQNIIRKTSIDKLGYNFIKSGYLPKGKDEYYLRNMQELQIFWSCTYR